MQEPPLGLLDAAGMNGAALGDGPSATVAPPLAVPPAAERAPPTEPAFLHTQQPGMAVPAAAATAAAGQGASDANSAAPAAAAQPGGQRRVTRASSRTAAELGGSDGAAGGDGRPPALQEVKRRLVELGAAFMFDKARQAAWVGTGKGGANRQSVRFPLAFSSAAAAPASNAATDRLSSAVSPHCRR